MSTLRKKYIPVLILSLALLGMLTPTRALAAPTVETYCATAIDGNSATLKGRLTDMGGADSVDVSFEWGTDEGGPYPYETNGKTMESADVFEIILRDELDPQTTYYFQAKAVGGGTANGSEKSFTTTGVSLGSLSNNVVSKGLVVTDATLDQLVSDVNSGTLTAAGTELASGIAETISGALMFIGELLSGIEPECGTNAGIIISDMLKLFGTRIPLAP